MIQYRQPVRANVAQDLTYTFKDEADVVIDLTSYASVLLESKVQGQAMTTPGAAFVNPRSGGVVQCPGVVFTTTGIWTVQFVALTPAGLKLFGEPLQLRVVANVEDLAIGNLLSY